MGRGGYNGGSTLIGAGRSWTFDPEFDRSAEEPSLRPNSHFRLPAPSDPAILEASPLVDKKLSRKQRMALLRNAERDRVLVGLGLRLPKKLSERGQALKRLVAEKILLHTGAINTDHPAVSAWLKAHGKKTKKHD